MHILDDTSLETEERPSLLADAREEFLLAALGVAMLLADSDDTDD